MIHNFLFDLGGVLIDLDVQRSLNAMKALAADDAETTINANGLLGGHDSQLINLYQTGDISTDDFLHTLLRACKPGTTRKQVEEAWFAMLLGIRADRQQLLADLKRKGYGIYILSNINELHVGWTMEHCPVLRQADALFFSNEIQLAKPDRRCYEYVLQQTGIRAEGTLYIDDLKPNIEAGQAAGFPCLLAQNDEWMGIVQSRYL